MIELRHLRKEFEDVTPLEDVNVTINSGDVISVIGPSGTGGLDIPDNKATNHLS